MGTPLASTRGRLASLLASLLLSAALPAAAGSLKAGAPASPDDSYPYVREDARLQAKLAAAEAQLQELHSLALQEAEAEDLDRLIPRRDELLLRFYPLANEIDTGQRELGLRIRESWLEQASALKVGSRSRSAKPEQVPGRIGPIMEAEDLNRRIGEFWKKKRAEVEAEQAAFDRAKARADAVSSRRRLLGSLAAGAGAAVLAFSAAVVRRRRRGA